MSECVCVCVCMYAGKYFWQKTSVRTKSIKSFFEWSAFCISETILVTIGPTSNSEKVFETIQELRPLMLSMEPSSFLSSRARCSSWSGRSGSSCSSRGFGGNPYWASCLEGNCSRDGFSVGAFSGYSF